jgi:midasin (ATPase involved in ribosome maturation)
VQLLFIISDGVLSSRESIVKWTREAAARNQLVVFIVLDNPGKPDSILDHQVCVVVVMIWVSA